MKKSIFLLILIFLFAVVPLSTFSQTEVTYPSIPGVLAPQEFMREVETQEELLPLFMTYLFHLLLVVSVVVAIFVIIYGGVLYVISSGDPEKRRAAKSWILSAVHGALIVFTSYALLFTLDSQLVLFQQRGLDDSDNVGRLDLKWEIKNVYFQIPFGLLVEDAILNETAQNKLYDVLDATYSAEDTADAIVEGSKQLLKIIEECPDGEPCCDDDGKVDSPPIEKDETENKERDKQWENIFGEESDKQKFASFNGAAFPILEEGLRISSEEKAGIEEEGCFPVAETEGTRYTEAFGYVTNRGGGLPDRWHSGQDIGADCGTDVFATHSGTVLYSGEDVPGGATGYQASVLYQSPSGDHYIINYAHFQKNSLSVQAGESISVGQKIAKVGQTGNNAGYCHLHYDVTKVPQNANLDTFIKPFSQPGLPTSRFDHSIDPIKNGFLPQKVDNFCSPPPAWTKSPTSFSASLFFIKNITFASSNNELKCEWAKGIYGEWKKYPDLNCQDRLRPRPHEDFLCRCYSGTDEHSRSWGSSCPSGYVQVANRECGLTFPWPIQSCCEKVGEDPKPYEPKIHEEETEKEDFLYPSTGPIEFCPDGGDLIWSEGTYTRGATKDCSKESLNCYINEVEHVITHYTDHLFYYYCCCEEEESHCDDGIEQLEPCEEDKQIREYTKDGETVYCCEEEEELDCADIGEGWEEADEDSCPEILIQHGCKDLTSEDGETTICCCPEKPFCLEDGCEVVMDGECPEGTEETGELDGMLCCCEEEEEEEEDCPACPDIAPAVRAKIAEIDGYMSELSQNLNVLLQTKEPIKEDLYQLYKAIMLKSLGHRQVFGYNSLLLERRYYEREEVVIETDTEKTQIGPYTWDWSQWIGNILYQIHVGDKVVEENDPATFYLRRPESNKLIEDALRLANEAKASDIQKIGKKVSSEKESSSTTLARIQSFASVFLAKTTPKEVLALSNMEKMERCLKDHGISDWSTLEGAEFAEYLEICEIDIPGTDLPDWTKIEVKTPADYLLCGMEIPVGEVFDLTWGHLIELLDTVDDYIEEGKKLIEQQAKMNSLAAPCDCPCEGDEKCPKECGECDLKCDLNAIRAAHEEVLKTRQKMREIATHIELLTYGHFNTPTENVCAPLNEDIRDEEEKTLCQGGGSKLITKHELITRKLNYSRYEFDECSTRPEHLEDVLEGKRAGKMPFFGPLVEERDLPRETKTKVGNIFINTSEFNWFCCSDARFEQ